MAAGAANLVDHVLPEHVPIRQWVLTLPFALRFPLAFDGALLGEVLRIFTDTVGAVDGHAIALKSDRQKAS